MIARFSILHFSFCILHSLLAPLGAQVPNQTDADHYTRYELLAPGSSKFRIIYEVTATTPGATKYFNAIRRGSIATDESVLDRATGQPLKWEVVKGTVARAGGVRGADSTGEYIMVTLSRPVPDGGEQRILIDKTYEDATSYIAGGDTIVFTRPLGIKKNSVVLPAGYELTSVNYPSQIRQETDGRIQVSFINIGTAQVPYVVKGRRLTGSAATGNARSITLPQPNAGTGQGASSTLAVPVAGANRNGRLSERARQDREIVYYLQQPETHSFDLYHDYTESRPGTTRYLNIVRGGSKVSNPSAMNLDTGEQLRVETLKGNAITTAGIDIGEPVTAESEVVVIHFAAVTQGQSTRLRIRETYTDPNRYVLNGDELVWDRAFGRPANTMMLPAGWYLTNSSIPATTHLHTDGRVVLDFVNPRNDNVEVLVTARRR
jgi:hypothetical protein